MTLRVLTFTALVAAFVPSVVASAQTPPPAPPLPANCTSVQQSFIGTICTPPSHERHPAIILLGGSEGGDLMARFAPLFAAHGYLAVSVAYFKEPGLPQTLVDVPVETIGRARRSPRSSPTCRHRSRGWASATTVSPKVARGRSAAASFRAWRAMPRRGNKSVTSS